MTSLIFYNYYYRFGEARKQVKQDIENNNISGAIIKLTQYFEQNNNYINNNQVPLDTDNIGKLDNFSLKHAKNHLQPSITVTISGGNPTTFIFPVNETNRQAAIDALNESYTEQ